MFREMWRAGTPPSKKGNSKISSSKKKFSSRRQTTRIDKLPKLVATHSKRLSSTKKKRHCTSVKSRSVLAPKTKLSKKRAIVQTPSDEDDDGSCSD